MISFSLTQTARLLNGHVVGADASFASVSTDSRTLAKGDLFVALQGPNFDGHAHLNQAQIKGAVAAMVSRQVESDLPQLQVADTRLGLGELAAHWRQASRAKVVAVTGSNGKTTVKEMIAAILSQQGQTLATLGNLNNDIGLPLTLLRLQDEAYAVVELGANHSGEIKCLSDIAQPNIALLNNAGSAHLEGFGSLEGVARAKAEIISGLAEDGIFVFNADDPWSGLWRELAVEHAICTFGLETEADVSSPKAEIETRWDASSFTTRFPVKTPRGAVEIDLPLVGYHNRMNALAAIATTQLMGVSLQQIRDGLMGLRPVPGRLQFCIGKDGICVIDDSYNANPASVAAAIAVLATAPGRQILVLGDLAELGQEAVQLHKTLGQQIRAAWIKNLYCLGELSSATAEGFGEGAALFQNHDALISALNEILIEGDTVLVKGSRSARMERVVDALVIGAGD